MPNLVITLENSCVMTYNKRNPDILEIAKMKNTKTKKIVLTALMAALCYVAFRFLKIDIPTPSGTKTALHIGNAFCVLCALLLGGVYGGAAGAIGMTIADLTDPSYIQSAPKTFVLKMIIGLVAGFVAHNIANISDKKHDAKYTVKWSLISSIAALGLNVILDPVVGYIYKRLILGIDADAAKIIATWAAGSTAINSLVGTVLVCVVYNLIRPALIRSGLYFEIPKKHKKKDSVSSGESEGKAE